MNTKDINLRKHLLEQLIHNAILNTIAWTIKSCVRKPQEPDYIATMSLMFPRDLFNILQAVFPNDEFSVTGVYCHQKPIVDIHESRKTELGDLLLVYMSEDYEGRKIMNSLLLQAKISNKLEKKVSLNESYQLKLYMEWPEFKYYRAGNLNGISRNILPKTITDGAQYLLIDDNPFTNGMDGDIRKFPIGCAIPDDILISDDSFSNEIINFIKFKSGRTCDIDYDKTEDEWSKMIWDLLTISSAKCSKRKNAGLSKFPRKSEYLHLYTEEMEGHSIFDRLLNTGGDFISEDNEGMSVIIIENMPSRRYSDWKYEPDIYN